MDQYEIELLRINNQQKKNSKDNYAKDYLKVLSIYLINELKSNRKVCTMTTFAIYLRYLCPEMVDS